MLISKINTFCFLKYGRKNMDYSDMDKIPINNSCKKEISDILFESIDPIKCNINNPKFIFVEEIWDDIFSKLKKINPSIIVNDTLIIDLVYEVVKNEIDQMESKDLVKYISSAIRFIKNNYNEDILKIISDSKNFEEDKISLCTIDNDVSIINMEENCSTLLDEKIQNIYNTYFSKIQLNIDDVDINKEIGDQSWYILKNDKLNNIYSLSKRRKSLAKLILEEWKNNNYEINIDDNLILNALIYAAITIIHSNWIEHKIYEDKINKFYLKPCRVIIDGENFTNMYPDKRKRINFSKFKELIIEKIQMNPVEILFCQANLNTTDVTELKNPFVEVLKKNNIKVKSSLDNIDKYREETNKDFKNIISDDLIIEELLVASKDSKSLPIVLVSGDSDFMEYIEKCTDNNIEITIISSLKRMCKRAIDKFININNNVKYVELTDEDLIKTSYENKTNNNFILKDKIIESKDSEQTDILEKNRKSSKKTKISISFSSNEFKEIKYDLADFINNLNLDSISKINIKI